MSFNFPFLRSHMGVGGCLQHPSERVAMTPRKLLFQEEEEQAEEEEEAEEDGEEKMIEIIEISSDEEINVIVSDDEQ